MGLDRRGAVEIGRGNENGIESERGSAGAGRRSGRWRRMGRGGRRGEEEEGREADFKWPARARYT